MDMTRSLGYLTPIVALQIVTSFVLTMLTNLFYWCRAGVLIPGSKSKSPKKSPSQCEDQPSSHYILDLRPDREATRKGSTSGGSFIPFLGKYSIPTIALANLSRLLVTTMTQLTMKCLYTPGEVLWTVLSATQLGVRGSRVDTAEGLSDDIYNHYIFDLRPEYGSDIAVILFDVLKTNCQITEPYFITKRRRRSRRFIKKCGWRLELVNSDRKIKATKKKSMLVKTQKDLNVSYSLNPNTTHDQLVQSQEWYCSREGIDQNLDTVQHLKEQFNIEQPIQDSDQDVDSLVPLTVPRTTCITCT